MGLEGWTKGWKKEKAKKRSVKRGPTVLRVRSKNKRATRVRVEGPTKMLKEPRDNEKHKSLANRETTDIDTICQIF